MYSQKDLNCDKGQECIKLPEAASIQLHVKFLWQILPVQAEVQIEYRLCYIYTNILSVHSYHSIHPCTEYGL